MNKHLSPPYASLLRFLILCCCALGIQQAFALNVTLGWNANQETDVAGYRVYYGTPAGNFGTMVDVGKVTQYQITGLDGTRSYSFRPTCYNTAGLESDPSAAVQYTPTTANQAPTGARPRAIPRKICV